MKKAKSWGNLDMDKCHFWASSYVVVVLNFFCSFRRPNTPALSSRPSAFARNKPHMIISCFCSSPRGRRRSPSPCRRPHTFLWQHTGIVWRKEQKILRTTHARRRSKVTRARVPIEISQTFGCSQNYKTFFNFNNLTLLSFAGQLLLKDNLQYWNVFFWKFEIIEQSKRIFD